MKEKIGDIWETDCDIICITTNGNVKSNGELVMGKGIALQAKKRYPDLPKLLGEFVSVFGNIPEMITCRDLNKIVCIISLPTKHNWWEKSDIELIKTSLIRISEMCFKEDTIAIPRPGCENGGLDWKNVKKHIKPFLDSRFTVYNLKK